jgi:hypothetical protein
LVVENSGIAVELALAVAAAVVRAEVTEDVTTVAWFDVVKVSVTSTAVAVVIVVKNVEAGGEESVTAVRATWL